MRKKVRTAKAMSARQRANRMLELRCSMFVKKTPDNGKYSSFAMASSNHIVLQSFATSERLSLSQDCEDVCDGIQAVKAFADSLLQDYHHFLRPMKDI